MLINFIPLGGLVILFLFNNVQCQLPVVEGSGLFYSGDGDLLGSGSNDGEENGSGDVVELVTTARLPLIETTTKFTIDDNEDGDSIDIIFSSGDNEQGSGSGGGEVISNMRCADSYLYCWCVDELEIEIAGTRAYIEDFNLDCNSAASTTPTTPTSVVQPSAEPDGHTVEVDELTSPIVEEMSTTTKYVPASSTRKPVRATPPPFVIGDDKTRPPPETAPPKVVGDTNGDSIGEAVDKNGIFGDEDVEQIDRKRIKPLFTHPGILAAVIGGGVVALLCAFLLIMFLVYRMRKKDEGSYPLDPDAKPPRLHTYTKAPNKEFYA